MILNKGVTCAGCLRDASDDPSYSTDEENVREDGTYFNKKYVCNDCYVRLIRTGHDVGPPEKIQFYAEMRRLGKLIL